MKYIIYAVMLMIFSSEGAMAQSESKADLKKTWHLQAPAGEYSGIEAVSYSCTVKDTVIVAVMDGGTDPLHPDLAENIWINKNEIPGNKIDDDHNGYVDDIYGWNFLGGSKGTVNYETLELTRLYRKETSVEGVKYCKIKKKYRKEVKLYSKNYNFYHNLLEQFRKMERDLHTDTPTAEQVANYNVEGKLAGRLKAALAFALSNNVTYKDFMAPLIEGEHQMYVMLNYNLNTAYNPRDTVGDDIKNVNERNYGNADVKGGTPLHGTHVAGIIGAVRNNSIGGDGVASAVKLMIVRVVPDGDERDKDVANGIRYAVDNGAKIINMSFGKDFSPDRQVVEDAVKYALSKDVLIVQGAGNDADDNDKVNNFPSPFIKSTGTRFPNYITVGATEPDGTPAAYSNYGKKSVDVFAPGSDIYSTLPDGEYGYESGTSMASPVVAGIAAIIRSCYPNLKAEQVREAIMKSATPNEAVVPMPGNHKKHIAFSTLSSSGGMVNVQRALMTAGNMMQ